MNKIVVALTLLAASATTAPAAFAQEQGRVLSATPVVQQIAIPRQVCSNQMVYAQRQPSGAGAFLGAVVGGLAGSTMGHGFGRAAATSLGMFGGSIVGNNLEAGPPGYYPMQRCGTQTSYETRTVAYDVTYEYAGRRYTTRTQYAPGQWIPLTVQPAPQGGYEPYYQDEQYGQQYEPYDGQYGQYDQSPQPYGQYQYQPPVQQQPQGYYGGNSYPQRGMVVSSPTGAYTAPVSDGNIEYRNSRGEPYRP